MNPSIWMYGGIHDDPGSRQRFLEELPKQGTAPHFVAVEWEQSVFERLAARRRWLAEGLRETLDFLTCEDCHELSCALAWEGDAYTQRFPGTDLLWLESGAQEARLLRPDSDVNTFAEGCASALRQRYWEPCLCPPQPRSKEELINRVWRTLWTSGGIRARTYGFTQQENLRPIY